MSKSRSIIELHLSIVDHRDGFPPASMLTSHHPIRVLGQSQVLRRCGFLGVLGEALGSAQAWLFEPSCANEGLMKAF